MARRGRLDAGIDLDAMEEDAETLVLAHWTYAGQGHTPGESLLAQTIAEQITFNRTTAREERQQLLPHVQEDAR